MIISGAWTMPYLVFVASCFLALAADEASDSLKSKICLRDAISESATSAFESCSISVQLDSLDNRVTALEGEETRYIALIEQDGAHGGDTVFWEPADYASAFEELKSHAATVFEHAS